MQHNRIYQTIQQFCEESQTENHRYLSWQHCYLFFDAERKKRKPDIDLSCLNLGFYLASWGMYRGSSFLLQKDYLVHAEVVQCLFEEKWKSLFDADKRILSRNETLPNQLCELAGEIRRHYHEPYTKTKNREARTADDVSNTLTTKVMMGAMGCTPAYDDFVMTFLGEAGMTQRFGEGSLNQVVNFIYNNEDEFRKAQNDFMFGRSKYPLMKLADMYFWQSGFEIAERKKAAKAKE